MTYKRDERGKLLCKMAQPLEPAEAPYYTWSVDPPRHPAPGWYWVPAGFEHPVYLGFNSTWAAIELHQHLAAMNGH
jgi:hypothetical protein